jgi:hypothetical protein
MNTLFKVMLLVSVAYQASAQNAIVEITSKTNSAMLKNSKYFLDQKTQSKKLDLNLLEANESGDLQILKQKGLNLKDVGSKFSAGGHDGNGGDAVVKNGQVSLLDLVEQQYKIFNPVKLGGTARSASRFISLRNAYGFFISKVGRVPVFPKELTWAFTNQPLEDIKDEGLIRTTLPGKLAQVAIQKDGFVLVYEPLFNAMDNHNQDSLVFHETLIATALRNHISLKSAIGTSPLRELVSLLMSTSPNTPTKQTYQNIWNRYPEANIYNYKKVDGNYVEGEAFMNFQLADPQIEINNESQYVYVYDHPQAEEVARSACYTISPFTTRPQTTSWVVGITARSGYLANFYSGTDTQIKYYNAGTYYLSYLSCRINFVTPLM